MLNFSEAVDPSRIADIVIHNSPQANISSIVINTEDANVVAEPGSSIVMLQLSDEDLRILKLDSSIGTDSLLNIYITIPTENISDFAGLHLMLAIPQAIITQQADMIVSDTSGAEVTSFDFDLNTGFFGIDI